MEAPYSETSRNIGAEQISVTRPTRVLSRANRSTVFPPLLSEAMQVEAVSASDILDVLRRDHSKTPPHRLLDALAFSSGLSWQTSAELLFAAELVQKKIDTDDVATTRCARTFWILYAIGREHYSRLTAEGVVPRLRGNWAWFSAQDFAALLPSAVIPRKLKRHQYLTNWVDDRGRFFLDVHDGSAAAPLFQHPFPNEFNPLVFGKSRKS
jgi:hypothetical protein